MSGKRQRKCRWTVLCALIGTSALTLSVQGQTEGSRGLLRSAHPLPNRYIVVLKDIALPATRVRTMTNELVATHAVKPRHTYTSVIKGFSIEATEDEARRLASHPSVAYIEEDGLVRADATQLNPPWGLDRLDQGDLPLDAQYRHSEAFKSVAVFVIDSGIRPTHSEFMRNGVSQAINGGDFIGGDGIDCSGHGTHVASTIGGQRAGVVKSVTIKSLRVLGCDNTGPYSAFIAAIDAVTHSSARPAVMNLSLGGPPSETLDNAIRAAVAAGVVVVVSAGNNNTDATAQSPARVQEAITVGASASADARSTSSNFGPAVDLFAPGASIVGAAITDDSSFAYKSGTSMAAPHVTGLAALYLDSHPTATPVEVTNWVVNHAALNRLGNIPSGTPNRLAQIGDLNTLSPDDATFVSYDVPAAITAGSLVDARVTFRNTGTNTWTQDWPYWLATHDQTSAFATVTGTLPISSVPPGESVTIPVTLRAPATPGQYLLSWQMVEAGPSSGTELARFFGQITPPKPVAVTAAVTGPPSTSEHFFRYLAEGTTNDFFKTRFALLNPNSETVLTWMRFLRADGTTVLHHMQIPGHTRTTVDAASIQGLEATDFSTVVESDGPLVVDRTMSWGNGYGSHAETAVASPATTWYLAEGATHSNFNLFYLLQNPSDTDAVVQVTYLPPTPASVVVKTYTVRANSRFSVWVNQEDPALANTDVSAVITSTNAIPIIVERSMYLDVGGSRFTAGHNSAGLTATSTSWFFAEGATGWFFDLFILVANPGPIDASITATYLLPSGSTIAKSYTVAANSRFNIWVDLQDPALVDTAVSTSIVSNVPVIVERSMWWPGPTSAWWTEAHNSPGSTMTGTKWAVAEGEVGGAAGTETYLLVANTSDVDATVSAVLLFEDGTTAERTFAIGAHSRFNIDVALEFPVSLDRRFGATLESLGATPAQLVVERAMYSNAGSAKWAAGSNALGTRLSP